MTDVAMNSLDDLAGLVRLSYPDARVEVHHFPSGAAMLDVLLGGRFFVVSSHASEGYGASEVRDGEGFLGHDHGFANLHDAKDFLLTTLDNAANSRPEHGSGKANTRAV